MRATPVARGPAPSGREFSPETIDELLRALHARAVDHPESPGLIASWPGVPADRMPAACAELRRQGHQVHEIAIVNGRARVRRGWTVDAATGAGAAPSQAIAPLTEEATVLVRGLAEPAIVPQARATLATIAGREGAPAAVCSAVALAVSEACTNVVQHGYVDADAPGNLEVRAWRNGAVLTVEVADDGRGIVPRADRPGLGLGMALIVRLADVVEIRSREHRGMVVRMAFSLDGTPDAGR